MVRFSMIPPLALALICLIGGCRHEPGTGDGGAATRPNLDAPVPTCPQPEHDFGTVRRGRPVRHAFELRNTGSTVLQIERVLTDCACAKARATSRRIPPGQSARIEVRLDTLGRSGAQDIKISVHTNAAQQALVKLRLKGRIEVLADLSTARLYLREVLKGTTRTELVGLEGSKLEDLMPGDPVSNAPDRLSGTWIEQDGQRKLKVTFTAGEKTGRFSGRLTMATGMDDPKELTLTVNALVTGDLVADRSHLTFGPYRQEHTPAFEVGLRSLSGKPFRVKSVEDPGGAVTGRAEQSDAGWRISLRLTEAPAQPRGRIRITTDRADQAVIELTYLVRGGQPTRPGEGLGKLKTLRKPPRPSLKLDRPRPAQPKAGGFNLHRVKPKSTRRLEKLHPDTPPPYPPPGTQTEQPTP